MMAETEEFVTTFVTEFHNLQGITIGDKKRSLFKLFDKALSLDAITNQLQPSTYLEEVFFVEFLTRFRRHNELSRELFINENPIVIKKIKHQKWFFEKILTDNRTTYILQVLSSLSYSTTLKILKNISAGLKEEQADEIFTSLFETYGISLAANILHCCSFDKIEKVLNDESLKLSSKQLKLIFDKNSSLIYFYLEKLKTHEGSVSSMDFNTVFEYIAQKNQDIYQDLCLKYDFKAKLGKRVTEKFVIRKRNDILKDPEVYVKNLHPRSVIRKLGPDFKAVFLKLFPRRIEDSPNALTSKLLKHYPKRNRYELMSTTYNQVFAKKLDESPHLIDEYVLEMVSDPAERERLAKLKSCEDPDQYLKYHSPENCLKIIKEKINFTRYPYERCNHVATLVQSCLINNDYDYLLEIAKFLTQRFQNDIPEVQKKFLEVLIWQKADFDKLNENHWTEIKKITARLDLSNVYDYTSEEIFYRFMEFLIESEKPIKNEVVNFFRKKKFDVNHVFSVTFYMKNKKAQKIFLRQFIELVPDFATDVRSVENWDCRVLSACGNYNAKNPKDQVDVWEYPRLIQSLEKAITGKFDVENDILSSALKVVICTKQAKEEVGELKRLLWNNTDLVTPFMIKWLLKYDPQVIEANLIPFMNFSLENSELIKDKKIWNLVKCHLNISTGVIQFCSNKLTPAKCQILSYLMPAGDFLALGESHKPGTNSQFKVQIALLNSLKNIKFSSGNFSLIMEFFCGDYLPFCFGPLWNTLSKIPKSQSSSYVEEMKRKDVSLQKCAYSFASMTFNNRDFLNSLKECQLNQSVGISFKYFFRNPSKEAWEVFSMKFSTKETDLCTWKLIVTKKIPPKYKSQHFETIWPMFNESNKKYKVLFLKNLQKETVLELKPEFLKKIIGTELFYQPEINKMVSLYFVTSNSDENMNVLSAALEKYKMSSQFSVKTLSEFIFVIFSTYMELGECNESLINGLSAMFQKVSLVVAMFKDYITIHLMKFKNQDMKNFTLSIIQLHNNLIQEYGETITDIFEEIMKKCLPYFCKSNLQTYEFLYFLACEKKSVADLLLVVKLLPVDKEPEDRESFKYYQLILSQFEEMNLPYIQLHLNLHFKQYRIERNISYYENISFCSSSWLCCGARKRIGYMYY